ncbi:MAG: D-alanyl-D-alanine carboxypeptidase [Clostridia bacterium]|nr:D-alanyl-D-alanine carboxypeptidase [Clostridia bacterium]
MNFNKIKLHNIRKMLLRSTAVSLCAVTISASAAFSVLAAPTPTKSATNSNSKTTASTAATASTTASSTASTSASNAATSAGNGTVQNTTDNSQGSSDNQWPASPTISAGSAILIDADTGAILYEKDSHSRAYPASTTKIMTSLLAIENSSLDDVITFSKAAANSYKWDEANTGTREGEQFTMEQALYATLLKSANEVAYGIGEYIAGSIPAFSDMMNERARELGALNTHFNNPNGLSDTNHYTTAYDLAMIGRACFNNSTFMTISSSVSYSIPPTNKTAETRYFRQRHGMANGNGYQYEYFKGGKTGFTDESGYTLITFAQKDDMRLICVVFRESDDASRYVDSKALFDYGFNNFKKASISSSDVSSLFNSSNYYNSNVFGNAGISFSMDSAYVDIPQSASITDIDISVSENIEASDNNYDFTADLSFNYGGHRVGTATLLVTTPKSDTKDTNLPYIQESTSSVVSQKKCLVINIWHVIIIIIVVLIIFEIIDTTHDNKMRKHRRRSYNRKRHR